MAIIELQNVSKTFSAKTYDVKALKNVSLKVEEGSSVAIIGPSGSGKTTLLKILGLLDTPTEGEVILKGENVTDLGDRKKSRLRGETFGYIVQDFDLINEDSVYRNIVVPLQYSRRIKRSQWRKMTEQYTSFLGIDGLLRHKAGVLSGGEKQRVAIARAMIGGQPVILADEPTGSLDLENRDIVIRLLMDLVHDEGKTLIMVTHDNLLAAMCDKQYELRGGSIKEVTCSPDL